MSVTRDGEGKIGGSVGSVHRLKGLAGLRRGQGDLLLDVVHVLQGSHGGGSVFVDRAFELCEENDCFGKYCIGRIKAVFDKENSIELKSIIPKVLKLNLKVN